LSWIAKEREREKNKEEENQRRKSKRIARVEIGPRRQPKFFSLTSTDQRHIRCGSQLFLFSTECLDGFLALTLVAQTTMAALQDKLIGK